MSSDPGPREYTTGTERALYTFSGTTCYFPGCTTRVIVFVDSEPVCNVEIAHIRGAHRKSARHDEAMTDGERRSFANLILLCKPHHNIVDRLHAEDYSPEVLAEWKSQYESDAGIDASALSSLTEDRLIELIEKAVAAGGPQRVVTVELRLGVVGPDGPILFPTATAKNYFDLYRTLGPSVIVLTVRSEGALKAYVNSHNLRFVPDGTTIQVTNDFVRVNPPLPSPVDIGESKSWMYNLDQVTTIVRLLRSQQKTATAVVGEASLGSGEVLTSPELPVELLGVDD